MGFCPTQYCLWCTPRAAVLVCVHQISANEVHQNVLGTLGSERLHELLYSWHNYDNIDGDKATKGMEVRWSPPLRDQPRR